MTRLAIELPDAVLYSILSASRSYVISVRLMTDPICCWLVDVHDNLNIVEAQFA